MRLATVAIVSLVAVLAAGGALGADDVASDGAPKRTIAYDGDALTVHLVKVPVADVLAEVGRQSGAEIRGEVREPRDVSAEFESVPVAEGLYRLLGNQNFALVYGENGKLKAVQLLGGPQTATATGVSIAPSVTATTTPAVSEPGAANLIAAVENHLPVPISGRLAQVIGTDSASLRQLIEVGLHYEDAAVRAEAIRATLQVIENEPAFRSTVLNAVNAVDETALVTLLRGSAGNRAEEVAMHVATQSRVAELRTKASSVLQRLRTGG